MAETAKTERDDLIAALSGLMKSATDAELDHIAAAEPGATAREVAKHLATLRTVIFKRNGHMTEKHVHYPGEVVNTVAEAAGEDPGGNPGRAFDIVTALLMLNALLDDDAHGTMSMLWEEWGPHYREIDRDFVAPVLTGFRWLCENATDWSYMQDPEMAVPIPSRAEIEAIGVAAGQETAGALGAGVGP